MKKPEKFTLELEDDAPEYEDMAFLFFHTSVPGYAFADDLNRLYRLALARQDDLVLREYRWPLYRYHDLVSKLTYLVVERPSGSRGAAPHWSEGHKLMVIHGDLADIRAEAIRDDFGAPPQLSPYPTPAEEERLCILESYQQELVPVSRFVPGETTDPRLPKKTAKERAELETLVYDLMDYLNLSRKEF